MSALLVHEVTSIVQEAVSNSLRHAHAQSVEVDINVDELDGELLLAVQDDGIGLPQKLQDLGSAGHFGIIGMRERAVRLGGAFSVSGRAPHGTRVLLVVPLAPWKACES